MIAQALARPDPVLAPAEAFPVGPAGQDFPPDVAQVPCPDFQGDGRMQCFDGGAIGPAFQPIGPVAGGDFWPKTVLAYILMTPIAIFAAAQSLSPTRRWHWPGRSRRHECRSRTLPC